jgi:hypothetical protein
MAMVDPMMLLMLTAANDPARMGPILDALGPQFGPQNMLPQINNLLGGINPPPSAPLTPGPAPNLDLSGGAQANTQTNVPGLDLATPPPGTPDLMTGVPPPNSIDNILRLFSQTGSMQPPAGVTPPTPPPSGIVPPPVPLTRTPPSNIQPQIRPPTAPPPITSGGVANAQKAPEIGVQNTTGGTPAQMLLAAILGGRNMPNPLRVPPLGALLGGGT